jgi:branched-chain amino acid transport system ATP-binding protein
MPPDQALLVARDLHVSYGPIKALRGCSLEIAAGETVAVVGANGAGKSTLLRALCNLLPRSTGSVYFDGADTAGVPTHVLARRDGMLLVPEDRAVLRSLTVIENLRLSHDARAAGRTFEAAAKEVFALFPRLQERAAQQAGGLSGGEQQMLTLARAIVSPPRILLLDEPSLGLSPRLVGDVYRILRDLRSRGTTILLVEQNVRAALRFADRGYVLRQGMIVKQGSGAELLSDTDLFSQYLGVH